MTSELFIVSSSWRDGGSSMWHPNNLSMPRIYNLAQRIIGTPNSINEVTSNQFSFETKIRNLSRYLISSQARTTIFKPQNSFLLFA